jgi:hypothetical protein
MWIGILAMIIVAATGITVCAIAAHQDIRDAQRSQEITDGAVANTKQPAKFHLGTVAINLVAALLITALACGPIIYALFWR